MFKISNILVLSITVLCVSNCSLPDEVPVSNQNIEDFEVVWESVNSVYPYLDFKQIDWGQIYNTYRPQAEKAVGDEIFDVLSGMLHELKDGHVYLTTAGGYKMKPYIPVRSLKNRYAYSPLVVHKYFNNGIHITGPWELEYGITDSNVGYIYISSFGSHIDFVNDLNAALEYTRDTKGLIIDVRHNIGGDGKNTHVVVSKFLLNPLKSLDTYVLGELQDETYIQPDEDYQYFNHVIVLINGVCFSATESFAELMKQVPTVTVVGDTTGGGSAGFYGYEPPASGNFQLPSGKMIHIGTMDIRRYDDLPFEWIGISPDIQVSQTEADINNGRDKQLEYAIEFIENLK
ncbi:S41 family peptidase [Bacteroidota bacterium]